MKPLAAPVLGGMVSSLIHVLVVTPVIFYWLRARTLPEPEKPEMTSGVFSPEKDTRRHSGFRRRLGGVACVIVVLAAAGLWWTWGDEPTAPSDRTVVQTTLVGDTEIRLLVDAGQAGLQSGTNRFWLEFRRQDTGLPLAVSDVRLSASMAHPGSVTSAAVALEPAGSGLYRGSARFGMSGTWRWSLEWRGSSGPQSTTFDGEVR